MSLKVLPENLTLENIGKPMEIRVFLREDDSVSDEWPGKYFGTLEAFYCDKNGMVIKLHGLELFVCGWERNLVEVYV